MNLFRTVALAGTVVIAGCTSAADEQAADRNRCSQYGFAPGTDQFAQCMMSSDLERQDRDAAALRTQQRRIAAENAALTADFRARMNADQQPASGR